MRLMVLRVGKLDILKDRVLATMFYEPSTRTCMSFTAAMERLGGSVIASYADSSSVKKGESLTDTVRTLEQYADAIVIRHPIPGSISHAAQFCAKPVINAGDGDGEHPTQALLDVFTIRRELGTVNRLHVTFVGDLKYGRTVHSLVRLLGLYEGVVFHYVSPVELKLPRNIYNEMETKGFEQREHTTVAKLEEIIPNVDVLYVTRIQKERFTNVEDYDRIKGGFIITPQLLSRAKSRMIVMHPLPRVDEISTDVDSDPRAAYFRQMENGMYVRMALLAILLGRA
jgi:aspartate carbamoyltransferase